MSVPTATTVPPPVCASTFDRRGWSLGERRVAALSCVAAFAVALWATGDRTMRVFAALLVLDAAVMVLPWRVPRTGRSGPGYWAETLAALCGPAAAVVWIAVTAPPWLTHFGSPWWYVGALGLGGVLIALSGVDPRALLSGELAFVLGPTPRAHGTARAFSSAISPFGEEVLFRTPGVLSVVSLPLSLLGAVAFVARHHVAPGTNGRLTRRTTAIEIGAAVLLLLMTALSRSVYPALLAHLLNNSAAAIRELQREKEERSRR